jgi:hypothetical protein
MASDDQRKNLRHDYGKVNFDYVAKFASWPEESDGPIFMINLMKYKDVASYDSPDAPAISGREADDRYNPSSVLNKIGASVVFVADVVDNHVGDEDWDRIGIVRYATRRSFVEMQSRKDFGEKHVHKAAGMERTTIVGGRPLDVSLDTRARPAPIEFRWVVMIVRQTPDRDAVLASLPHAVSFTSEGTVISDGRMWDTVQFIPVANQAEGRALAMSLTELQPGSSYAMTLRATLDGLTS